VTFRTSECNFARGELRRLDLDRIHSDEQAMHGKRRPRSHPLRPFDVARQLPAAVVNRWASIAVAVVLAAVVANQLARLAATFNRGMTPVQPVGQHAPRAAASGIDLSVLSGASLFGEAQRGRIASIAAVAPTDGPDTALPLRLSGILFAEGAADSAAIIVTVDRTELTYRIGDVVDPQSMTTLQAVLADRVVLKHGERFETLRQPNDFGDAGAQVAAAPEDFAPEVPSAPSEDEVVAANAAIAADVIQVAPDYDADRFVGFRVGPGQDVARFEGLGLRAGDVITGVNGAAVDDPAGGTALLDAITKAVTPSLSIIRNGRPQFVVINAAAVARFGGS
jgi:general secretion pathway protein C